jgi:hypothetical protein
MASVFAQPVQTALAVHGGESQPDLAVKDALSNKCAIP